jgi:hypothetical protein
MLYVIARSLSKRPTLMHVVGVKSRTLCGTDISMWSAAYRQDVIKEVLCIKCQTLSNQ